MSAVKTPRAITDMSTLSRVIFDPDTTPPSIPTNVIGTPVSSTRIDLTWGGSSDTGGSGMSGYLIYRNGAQVGSTNTTTFSDTGLVSSTAYLYQLSAVDGAGNVSSLSTTICVTTQANVGPPVYAQDQPKAALIGIAGVRTYTDPTQQAAIGRYNWAVLGASWEGWASGGRDLDVIVKAIKAASAAPGGTLLFNYVNLNAIEEDSQDPRPTWTAEVAARNWRLYVTNTTTLVTPNSGSGATALVNYTDFVPVNPSLEHPYEFGAKYAYYMYLSKPKPDARFTGLAAGLASSSLDGVFSDNFLGNPQVNGDWNRDGVTEGQGWPCTATVWLQQGQLRYCNAMRVLAPTKYICFNGGDYGRVAPGVMAQKGDSILAESYMGKDWSYETQNGFVTMLGYYYKVLSAASNPELVIFGGSWPDTKTDGSALTRLPTAGGFPPAYTQEQWARYIAGGAYLGEGMAAISQFSKGYSSDLADLYWPWFYGGVNGLGRSWMGKPVDALRPTTPKLAKGTIGIYGVERTKGIHLVNPRGNGAQVINAADIPGSWQYPAGSPQGSGTFTSYTLAENDALFLQRVTPASYTPAFVETFDSYSNGANYPKAVYGSGVIDSSRSYSGANSVRFNMVAGQTDAPGMSVAVAATVGQGTGVWFRIRTYFPVGFNFSANPWLKWMRIDSGSPASGGHGSHIDIYLKGGGVNGGGTFDFIQEGVQQWMFEGTAVAPPASGIICGQWQTWELYYLLHAIPTNAVIRMYRNGVRIIDTSANIPANVPKRATLGSATDIVGNTGNAQGFMHVTYVNGGAPATQSWNSDDWKIAQSGLAVPTDLDDVGNPFLGLKP